MGRDDDRKEGRDDDRKEGREGRGMIGEGREGRGNDGGQGGRRWKCKYERR